MEAQVIPVPPADTAIMQEVLHTDPMSPSSPPVPPEEIAKPAEAPPVEAVKEAAAEPPAVVQQAPPAKPYTAGQFIDPSTYDTSRVPQGYKCEDGRITRQNKTSSGRPEGIWP